MAPRETLPPSTNIAFLEPGALNPAQREALMKGTPPPYSPPKVDWKLRDVPMAESTSTFSQAEGSAQAQVMRDAARDGTPFCEECSKASEEEAAEDEAQDGPGGDDWDVD